MNNNIKKILMYRFTPELKKIEKINHFSNNSSKMKKLKKLLLMMMKLTWKHKNIKKILNNKKTLSNLHKNNTIIKILASKKKIIATKIRKSAKKDLHSAKAFSSLRNKRKITLLKKILQCSIQ